MTYFHHSSMIAAMRSLLLKIFGSLVLILLGACNFPKPGQSVPALTVAPNTAPASETVEPAQDYGSAECAFMWANEPLPELSNEFNQTLQGVLPEAEGYAQAYGENCVTNQGNVVRFLAMETDFYITIQVENLEDRPALGKSIEQVMGILANFPTEETPGPQPGYIGITFETPNDSLRLWAMRTEAESALENGLQGSDLFDALQTK